MALESEDELSPDLKRYLELCKRMYLRMEEENSWPWLNGEEK